jgi:hypothetical protein
MINDDMTNALADLSLAANRRLATSEKLRSAANAVLSSELQLCLTKATMETAIHEVVQAWTDAMKRDDLLRGELPMNLLWAMHKRLGMACSETAIGL